MGTQNVFSENVKVEVVKTCDLPKSAAIAAFVALNEDEGKELEVKAVARSYVIQSVQDPAEMLFPGGWYFAKGSLRNKHHSTTGAYAEIEVVDATGRSWITHAVEAARQCKGEDFSAQVCARVIAALNGAKLVGPSYVVVETGKPIKIIEGWTVCDTCAMGFILKSGDKAVKVFFA